MMRRLRNWAGSMLLGASLMIACSGNKNNTAGETASAAARQELGSKADSVEQRIKDFVAKQLDVSSADVEVSIFEEADVPGMTVFRAYIPSLKAGRPGRYSYGVVAGDTIEADRKKATTMVIDAWDYGPERTVPPERVALVLGVFEGGSREPADAFLTQAQIDQMREEQRKVMFLPRETTVNGKLAVEYWAASSEVPLWKTTAVINPDRTVELSIEEFWD